MGFLDDFERAIAEYDDAAVLAPAPERVRLSVRVEPHVKTAFDVRRRKRGLSVQGVLEGLVLGWVRGELD